MTSAFQIRVAEFQVLFLGYIGLEYVLIHTRDQDVPTFCDSCLHEMDLNFLEGFSL